jgi:hypothetical protein
MAGISSHRASSYLAVSILAVSILALVVYYLRSDTSDRADTHGAASELSGAKPASPRAPTLPSPRTFANEGGEPDQQAFEEDSRQLPAGVELTPEQERRVKELVRARERWNAEYEAELDALQQLNKVPLENRDREASQSARERLLALRRSEPVGYDFLPELSAEEREMVAPTRRPQFEDPSNGVDLSDAQRRRIEELPKARRGWQVRNRRELDALREQLSNARLEGDTAAELEAKNALEQLTATRPTYDDIVSERTDE